MRVIDRSTAAGHAGMSLISSLSNHARRLLRFTALVFVAVTIVAVVASAEEASAPAGNSPTRAQLETQVSLLQDYIKAHEAVWKTAPIDPAVTQAYIKTKARAYEFAIQEMDITVRAYQAQEIASYVILALVVFVVGAAVVFSGFQLWKSMSTGVQTTSDLEVSAGKVRVTSSTVGIVVLTISLVFLYIYTTEIYHISPVAGAAPNPAQQTQANAGR